MKNNPVYKREMLVRSRSFRIPLIIMIFNGILAVVALLNMYQSIAQVKVSGSVRYENFLQLYAFVAALEFMLLMFIMPALTSASISGERERHTLELMFTTKIRPVEIVVGKLMSAFSQLMILVVSSLPILMLTFIYGSISSGGSHDPSCELCGGGAVLWKPRNLRVLPHEAFHILQCDHLRDSC